MEWWNYGVKRTLTVSNSYYPILYAGQIGAGINTTSVTIPSIKKGNDPFEESNKSLKNELTTDSTVKQATGKLTVVQTYYDIDINSTNYGEAANVLKTEELYWVAAIYADIGDSVAFGLRAASDITYGAPMYASFNWQGTGYNLYLRPIVSIPACDFLGTKDSNGAWNLIE